MHLYALEGTVPLPASKATKGKDYRCPECHSIVHLRSGPSRQSHFYHLTAPRKCRQHQKSEEHLQLQAKFLDLIGEEAQMECPFPSIQRIADIAWPTQKIIFEIQCSPISLQEAKARTHDYESAGFNLIWILHDKQFNRGHLSASENYLRSTPCYYSNINKIGQGIIYDQFDFILGSRRLFKGPQLPVSPAKISRLPSIAPPDIVLPKAVLMRLASWKYCAAGDLLDRILKEGNLSLAAKKMIDLESYLGRDKKNTGSNRLSLKELLIKTYLFALDWALKKTSNGHS